MESGESQTANAASKPEGLINEAAEIMSGGAGATAYQFNWRDGKSLKEMDTESMLAAYKGMSDEEFYATVSGLGDEIKGMQSYVADKNRDVKAYTAKC